ncbi:cell adhesion molecule Dscam2-like [Amphiura filiformis]|uniref:cell adhesion molecule Dscam2-like n=1 Tax=Amphiura filiformis TaxID=82378 RepID=UPI003B2269EE
MLPLHHLALVALQCAFAASLQFTQEPTNHVAVETQPTWWHCVARGNPIPSYTWYFNDQPIRTGQANYNVMTNGTLHIYSVNANSVGTYQCQAQAAAEIIISSPVRLKLAEISRIFSTSPSSQSSNLGSSVIFECAISSSPTALITWQLNGNDVNNGRTVTMATGDSTTTRSTLTLSSLQHDDRGQYRCLAVNPLLGPPVVYSEPATLTLIGRPGFITTPSPTTAIVGSTVSFQCETTGSPVARIEWINSNNQIIRTSGRFTATQTGLTISEVRQSDAGYYTCQATNEWGENTAVALLTVTDPSQQVFLTRTPTDQSVAVGARATFSCEATGNPAPRITWNKIGGSLPVGRIEEPAVGWLRITNVQPSDAGIYRCTASTQLDSTTAQAQLIVLEGPLLSVTPEDTIVEEGRVAVLQCQAGGSPSPAITWMTPVPGLSSIEAPGGPFSSVVVSGDGTLTVSNVEVHHAGTYTCTASNSVGTSSAEAYLDVQRAPVLTATPSDKTVVEGGSVFFRCRAEGNPAAQISWRRFDGTELMSDAKHSVYGNGDLMISNIEKQQEGQYTCTARNALGEVSQSVNLRVLIPPQFVSFPLDQVIELGDTVQLECVVTGDPQPDIEWVKDGEQIVLESNIVFVAGSILIQGVTKVNLGAYTCIATNEAGNNQMTAMLLTPDVPTFTLAPVNTTANVTHTVTIPCRANAREAPSIRWYTATSEGNQLREIGLGKPTSLASQGATTFISVEGDLEFTEVRQIDEGWYLCVADNSIGRVTGNVFLTVNLPPIISNTNSPLVGKEGDAYLLLECNVLGKPKPQITWLLPSGDPISTDPTKYNMQPGSGFLVVYSPNVEEHDGDFTCVASNLLGTVEVAVTVTIRGPPVLRNILITHTDTSVTILCLMKGSPAPTITWLQDSFQIVGNSLSGHSINGEGALVITDLEALQNYAYYCRASNIEGTLSSRIQLPGTPSAPRITAKTSTTIDIAWTGLQPVGHLNITSYRLQYLKFGEASYIDVATAIKATSYRVTDLQPYTGYTFRIQAVNDLGPGEYSLPTQVTLTAESDPLEPEDITVETFETEIHVTWSPPAALNGHPDNIAYEIAYGAVARPIGQATLLYKRQNDPPLSVQLSNLVVETTYSIRIRAVNTVLNKWSRYTAINATTQYQAPTRAIQEVYAVANSSDSIFVTWQAIQDRTFQAYHISYGTQYPNASYMYATINITDMTAESALIDGLLGGTDYVVWMTYSNKGGVAPNSTVISLTTKPVSTILPKAQSSDLPLPLGIIIAIAVGCFAFILLLVIIILVIRQRHSGSMGGRFWHTRLNPDALWIHKRNSFSDDMSLGDNSSSGGSTGQRTGTYDVAMVNQNYQPHDDTAMSTASDYDLGGDYEDISTSTKKKKKKGLRDVIFKSRDNPDVVLVSKAVIGDHSPPPVALNPPTSSEAPQRSLAEMLVPYPDDAPNEKDPSHTDNEKDPSQADISVISSVSTDFPVFPNADDTLKLANELQVDSKQMRKMARKAERDQKRKMRHEAGQKSKKKPSFSDRLGKKFSGKSRKKPVLTSYAQGDFMLSTNRQRENAAMF